MADNNDIATGADYEAPWVEGKYLESLDTAAVSRRHIRVWSGAMAANFFDGWDVVTLGLVLTPILTEFHLGKAKAGVLASMVFIGMLIGAVGAGWLADRLGRKRVLIAGTGFYGAMSIFAAFSVDIWTLGAARILQGLGLGATVVLAFAYISEYVPNRTRGRFLGVQGSVFDFAALIVALVASVVVPAFGWRPMFLIGAAALLLVPFMWWAMPESPRYLLVKGELDAVRSAHANITGQTNKRTTVVASGSRTEDAVAKRRIGVRRLFTGKFRAYTPALWYLQFANGFIIFGILTWVPTIVATRGFSVAGSLRLSAAVIIAGIVGLGVSGFLMDWLGRRAVFVLYFGLAGISMGIWGIQNTNGGLLIWGIIAGFFGLGTFSVCFAYNTELYPTRLRSTATGWGGGWQRVGGILAPSILGVMLGAGVGLPVVFGFVGGLMIIAAIVSALWTYETRGRSLEEIETLLEVSETA